MDLQKREQAAVISSHLELPGGSAARGGIAVLCVRGSHTAPWTKSVCQQEITSSDHPRRQTDPSSPPQDGLWCNPPLGAAQIPQPAETLPMSQGAGPIHIRQGNPDMRRLWGHQSRGWWPLCHQIHLNLLPSCRSSTGSGREGAVEGTVSSGSFLVWIVVPFF